jgi:deoxyhypusine synthase
MCDVSAFTLVPQAVMTETGDRLLGTLPAILQTAVLGESSEMPAGSVPVKGYDFNNGVDLNAVLQSFATTGFQATNFGLAVDEINKMLAWRLSDEPVAPDEIDIDGNPPDPEARAKVRTTIFLGCTSNLISAGTRETIRYLVEHKKVSCLVTTAGGVEEDLIKCMAHHYMGDFALKGAELRSKGINRIGNLLVPNRNYCLFEDWFSPILDEMLAEQLGATKTIWTPSTMIKRMGERINDKSSVLYWAAKNDIPIFCPAITDGSIGDMIYFHSFKNPGFICDIAQDIRKLNDMARTARRTGMLIFGGGLVKHHICNANLMRNGANYSVFVNTAHDFDGSDSGAKPDEAVSWGKIRLDATPVKVTAEATLIMPLLVAQTFAREGETPAK